MTNAKLNIKLTPRQRETIKNPIEKRILKACLYLYVIHPDDREIKTELKKIGFFNIGVLLSLLMRDYLEDAIKQIMEANDD